MTTEEWIKRRPLMEQESWEEADKYLHPIRMHSDALRNIFSNIVDKIHPMENTIVGDLTPKQVAESEITDASAQIKEHLIEMYRLTWSLHNALIERAKQGILVCNDKFVKKFNLTIEKIQSNLIFDNKTIISLSDDSNPPTWFNTVQHKDGTEHGPYMTLQILYYECRKVADTFFNMVNKLRTMEPKIEVPQKLTNYITNAQTITALESQYPLSKEIKSAKTQATAELRKTYPNAFIA